MTSNRSSSRRRQAGFTLIELAISLIVVIEVLLGVLLLFDFTSKLSHAQTNIADMQQSLRVAQSEIETMVRMAGRGELKFTTATPGQAVWVRDNVPANSNIGDATSPQVVDGTDVLTVRGVFTTPLYQINAKDKTTIVFYKADAVTTTSDPALATFVKLTVSNISPTFFTQDLQPLAEAKAKGISEALVLKDASNFDNYAVVELIPGSPNTTVTATQAVLWCQIRTSLLVTSYAKLGPGGTYPPKLSSVMSLGILEEYRFYVRKNFAIVGNPASEPMPKLARARFMPGTDTPYGPSDPASTPTNTANMSLDLADNVLDLQVALGIDTTFHAPRTRPPGAPAEPAGLTTILADPVNGYISEAANGVNDDWLYNSTADAVTDLPWSAGQVYYARVSLLARTDRRDWKYEAPVLGTIEDRTYLATDALNVANATAGSTKQRQYRRRILQTVINMRNL